MACPTLVFRSGNLIMIVEGWIIDHWQVITQMFHDSLALRRFTRPVTTFKNDQGTSFSCGSHIWR